MYNRSPRHMMTDKSQCQQNAAACLDTSSTTACHTCCTGSTSQNVSTTNSESQCIAVCSTRLQSRVPGRPTAVHQSETFPADVIYGQRLDITSLLAQHFRLSGLLCRWSDGLELVTGQSPWPGAQQQQLHTIAEDEPISSLPLNTHSAVEMHNSALYKSTDIDIHQTSIPFHEFPRISR